MFNYQYISLGCGCASAKLIKTKGLREASYPLDWILSSPSSVHYFLSNLLESKMQIEDIVRNEFLNLNYLEPGGRNGTEHYFTKNKNDKGCLINIKHNLVMPHDGDYNLFVNNSVQRKSTEEKYIRRFKRLKDMIVNPNRPIAALMTLISSEDYTINKSIVYNWNRILLQDIYHIYNLLKKFNKNNRLGLHGRNFKEIEKYEQTISFAKSHDGVYFHKQIADGNFFES